MTSIGGLRLVSPGIATAAETIGFTFEGDDLTGLEGETIGAALAASGVLDLRQAGVGDRRGLFCGMGACQDCLVEIDGKGGQRACMTKLAPGMQIKRHDPDRNALAALASRPEAEAPLEERDVAIVGAGPAALAAAEILARGGARVVLLDERDAPGGQYFKPLAPSHTFADQPTDKQFADGLQRREAALAAGAEIRTGAMVWQAAIGSAGHPELAVLSNGTAGRIAAKAVLIATGAYEAPHHVPGWTLPGVMTAGAAQTLARAYRVSPGHRVLVAGNGPLNWQVALELARGGATVVAVLESARPSRLGTLPHLLGMARAAPALAFEGVRMRAELMRHGVPIHEGMIVTALLGEGRVQTVEARGANGRVRRFEADAVSLGYGFLPSLEVLRMLGGAVEVDPATGSARPRRDEKGRTTRSGVWVAGDGAGIAGSQAALAAGEIAARDILTALRRDGGDDAPARARRSQALDFQRHLWTLFEPAVKAPEPKPDTVICRCENVTAYQIAAMRDEGVEDLGSLKRRTRLGMGRCQGRYCAGRALKMLRGDLSGASEADLFAPQAPARPVPVAALAVEKGEWGGHREVPTDRIPRGAHRSDALPARADLVVIGGGVTGAATALYAARAGMDVVVVDRSAPNSQASGGNAGSLHVQLLSWDFGSKAMAGGSPAQKTLSLQRDSVALWKALEVELSSDFEIVTTGGLMVAEDEAQAVFLRQKAAAERAVGIDTQVIGREELAALAPAISQRMVVAAYCAAEGKINPLKGTPAIVAAAKAAGARFIAGHQITRIEASGADYAISSAAGGEITATRVVLAAGGWTRHLGQMLGTNLPISGAPLQMLVTEPTRPILKQLVAHADRHLTMKQASNGNLIIGGAWTAGIHEETGYSRVLRESIEGNLWVAERTVPAMAGLHLLRSWAAMNINIDGAPLLGALPGHPNVLVAATANGYTLGPMMGQITAALAAGQDPGRAIEYFTLSRFG
ncbi:FAD-dependent oxidoreductase [Arsenicitalea aurantiaca]|uniref:FAD-dependent oxidoreductase n=1 Tax=Arsenicitalea aurantiaca TaxID=1783274 RepID=A0A433XET5_9HYPH|nr:FAD-dependent oxidoreductase [Arsenicitalea aurantiaca]RUT32458.1 FAD-dependent oxidoreductase [Arsenicitalea aurantiaca]